MKILISESQLRTIVEKSFAYHVGDLEKNTDNEFNKEKLKPYYSESIVMIDSTRGTGHFGSGMYFSTYNCKGWEEKDYSQNYDEKDPHVSDLHKMKNGLYRVDMDLYKNLYRVKNYNQGLYLHQTLKAFNNLWGTGDSKNYYPLKNNLEYLGLKIPPYKELLKMVEKAKSDKENGSWSNRSDKYDPRSMSTRIMEYNGYNGVNVSGIPELDNTTYGSVIYDISKWDEDTERIPANKVNNFCKMERSNATGAHYITDKTPWGKTLEKNILDRLYDGAVFGVKGAPSNDDFYLESIPEKLLPHFFKIYKHFINDYEFNMLNSKIQNAYLNALPRKFIEGTMEYHKIGIDLLPIIKNRFNYIFNPNYKIGGKSSRWEHSEGTPLLNLIFYNSFSFDDNIIKQITDKIESGSVKLSPEQQEAYDDYKKEWDEYNKI